MTITKHTEYYPCKLFKYQASQYEPLSSIRTTIAYSFARIFAITPSSSPSLEIHNIQPTEEHINTIKLWIQYAKNCNEKHRDRMKDCASICHWVYRHLEKMSTRTSVNDTDTKEAYVCTQSGKIEAILLCRETENYIEIEWLATSPLNIQSFPTPWKTRGAGTLLVKHAMNQGVKKNKTIVLDCIDSSIAFYQKLGFPAERISDISLTPAEIIERHPDLGRVS